MPPWFSVRNVFVINPFNMSKPAFTIPQRKLLILIKKFGRVTYSLMLLA